MRTAGVVSQFATVLLAGLGCSGAEISGRSLGTDAPAFVRLSVAPQAAQHMVGDRVALIAYGHYRDGDSLPVAAAWSSREGAIADAWYDAVSEGVDTIRAVSKVQPSLIGAATITVLSSLDLAQIRLTPQAPVVASGRSIQFAARAVFPDGSEIVPDVTWSSTGGTITATGLFSAVGPTGTYQVTAQLKGRTKSGSTSVTVLPPVLDVLSLNPSSVALAAGETRQFTVAGVWSDGSTTAPAVTYAATGGTITSAGLYTAGTSTGTYQVIATQQGGTSADTSAVSVTAPPPPPPPPAPPNSSCQRTVNASTLLGLTTALSTALPGDCIQLAAGTYTLASNLTIARSGTSSLPIRIQGAGSSTIISVNQHFMYVDASYVQLRRLRLTDFNTVGLWFRGVTGVVVDSVEVDHTLQEAMAFKSGSHHNVVMNSLFHDTGILYPQYGEGIYVGSFGAPNGGVTDNQILNNHFGPNVRAEGVDVKEGSDRTLIRGNFFDGAGAVYLVNQTQGLVSVAANAVTVDSNVMRLGNPHGVTFIKGVGTMSGNVATRNTMDLQNTHGYALPIYGFNLFAGTSSGVTVSCNNVMLSGTLSNRPCAP